MCQLASGLLIIPRPDRWDNLPESTSTLPGIYSKTMTFSMGPRVCRLIFRLDYPLFTPVQACIGFKLSIMECVGISTTTCPSPLTLFQDQALPLHPSVPL